MPVTSLQVYQFGVARGIHSPSGRAVYDLSVNEETVPNFAAEADLLQWTDRIVKGDPRRVTQFGEPPMSNPSAAAPASGVSSMPSAPASPKNPPPKPRPRWLDPHRSLIVAGASRASPLWERPAHPISPEHRLGFFRLPAAPLVASLPLMPSIHLLNKAGSPLQPEEIPPGSGIWESGLWLVSVERAESLKGHPIHFHRRQSDAAFFSGIVTDYRRELYVSPKGSTSPRTLFILTPLSDSPEVLTAPEGWTPAGVKYIH